MEEKRAIEVNAEVYRRFFELVGSPEEGKKVSQSRAAQALGVSAALISAYKSKTYNGNIESLEEKINGWLTVEAHRMENLHVPIVDTIVAQQIFRALAIVHEERCIGVIVGEAGIGKTTSVHRYMEKNPSAILIEVDQNFTKRTLVLAIAGAVGVDTKGGVAAICTRIIEVLRNRDTLLIFDEAEYMPDICLELVRRVINDKANTGVVFVGMKALEYKLRNLQRDHRQLLSRVGAFLKLDTLGKQDALKILSAIWQDLSKEVVDAFVKAANGSVRVLTILMNRVHQTVNINRLEAPTVEAILRASESIMC
jgi:DNA transposition AAA+ family ATPase